MTTAAALKAWETRRARAAGCYVPVRRPAPTIVASCMTVCCKPRVSAGHLATASHRAAAARKFHDGAMPKGRPGWMIALRADPDEQYADRWPDYAPMAPGPLFGIYQEDAR